MTETAITPDEQVRSACEAFLWTSLARNNAEFRMTETMLAVMVNMMISKGVYLHEGQLHMPPGKYQ